LAKTLEAIGWLGAGHDYAHGPIGRMERKRLGRLLLHPWEYMQFMGYHTCELCGSYRSNGGLFIPGENTVFIAPAAIAHYIDEHDYLPPRAFLDAMLSCPTMSSDEYFSALAMAGGKEFIEMVTLGRPYTCPSYGKGLIITRANRCYFCKKNWN
jgi:hypothetical protein